MFLFNISKIILAVTLLAAIGFIPSVILEIFPPEQLNLFTNVFQLATGFAVGVLLLVYMRFSSNRFDIMGTALAMLSWTIGQLFWFSYNHVVGDSLPYPSVGDFGFTGTYFMLIGVVTMVSRRYAGNPKSPFRLLAFLVMILPVILLYIGKDTIGALLFNFVLSAVIAYLIFISFPLFKIRQYRWFVAGIFILGITDMIFMSVTTLFPEGYAFAADPFYPVSLALISFGIVKGDY